MRPAGGRCQERLGVGHARIGQDLGGGSALDDPSGVHDRDPVGLFGDHAEVVGDEDQAHAEVVAQRAEHGHDLGLDGGVEGGGGFVGDEESWAGGDRQGDGGALTHASGQFVDVLGQALLGLGHAGLRQRLDRPLPRLIAAHAFVRADGVHDLRADGQQRVEGGAGVLEDHGDPVAAYLPPGAPVQAAQVGAVQQDRPGGLAQGRGRVEAEQAQGGDGLARTGLAHDGEGLTGVEVQADLVHSAHGRFVGGAVEGDAELG